ncbi:hypothetical protein BDV93DRAFT_524593 [Ceratobasidium sp. AG-I]|nr:hypothetical protein BDV93DRAFT_524593 [Ceratobasidium sp. AG-I]
MERRKRLIRTIKPEKVAEFELREGTPGDFFALQPFESFWSAHYQYLLDKGYRLRPRFRSDWVRSWKGTNRYPEDCEDTWSRTSKLTLDAVRVSDGRQVMIKKLLPSTDDSGDDGDKELKIVQYLSSKDLTLDPRNHAMPYLDSFPIPDTPDGIFLVTPLFVSWDEVPLVTVNDAIDFIQQVLEGLSFLHDHRIAHRDCTPPNIMMDWQNLIDEPFHPIRNECSLDGEYYLKIRDRSQAPVKYYFIDFGLSTWFEDDAAPRLVTGKYGREQEVPELHESNPYDPFQVDIFIVGAFLQRELMRKYRGLSFLRPMLRKMTRADPKHRPNAAQVVQTFDGLVGKISPRNRKWLLADPKPGYLNSVVFALSRSWNQSMFSIQQFFLMIFRRLRLTS